MHLIKYREEYTSISNMKKSAMQELYIYIYIDYYRVICIHIYL